MSADRDLYPVDRKKLDRIKSPTLRELIGKEYDPRDTVKGYWSVVIDEILFTQDGRYNGKEN